MASGFAQSLAEGRGGAESVSLHFLDSVSELLNSVPSAHRPCQVPGSMLLCLGDKRQDTWCPDFWQEATRLTVCPTPRGQMLARGL